MNPHDEANRQTAILMAREILVDAQSTESEREEAWDALKRLEGCRVCGCTEERPCPAGCAWVEGLGNLCSVCARTAAEITMSIIPWLSCTEDAHPRRLVREVRLQLAGLRDQFLAGEIEEPAIERTPVLYSANGGRLL